MGRRYVGTRRVWHKLSAPLEESRPPQQHGLSDALRAAIESTLSTLVDPGVGQAAELRAAGLERAAELLDEVARRGHEARAEIVRRGVHTRTELARRGVDAGADLARRGQEAAGASAAITARVVEAVWDTLRPESKPKVEGEG